MGGAVAHHRSESNWSFLESTSQSTARIKVTDWLFCTAGIKKTKRHTTKTNKQKLNMKYACGKRNVCSGEMSDFERSSTSNEAL